MLIFHDSLYTVLGFARSSFVFHFYFSLLFRAFWKSDTESSARISTRKWVGVGEGRGHQQYQEGHNKFKEGRQICVLWHMNFFCLHRRGGGCPFVLVQAPIFMLFIRTKCKWLSMKACKCYRAYIGVGAVTYALCLYALHPSHLLHMWNSFLHRFIKQVYISTI